MTIGQQIVAATTDTLVLGAVAILIALHLAHSRSVRAAARFAAAVLLAWTVAHVLKFLVNDPRPTGGIVDVWGSGWPSGHAAVGAAAAFALWSAYASAARGRVSRVALALALAALAIGLAWSRLYLGVHDSGDVLGGLAVGAFAGYLLRVRR